MKHNPRYVVRKGSLLQEEYLQQDGSWGSYKTAKRFTDENKAEVFYRKHHEGDNYGLFPCS